MRLTLEISSVSLALRSVKLNSCKRKDCSLPTLQCNEFRLITWTELSVLTCFGVEMPVLCTAQSECAMVEKCFNHTHLLKTMISEPSEARTTHKIFDEFLFLDYIVQSIGVQSNPLLTFAIDEKAEAGVKAFHSVFLDVNIACPDSQMHH